jgi:hypothetical protein
VKNKLKEIRNEYYYSDNRNKNKDEIYNLIGGIMKGFIEEEEKEEGKEKEKEGKEKEKEKEEVKNEKKYIYWNFELFKESIKEKEKEKKENENKNKKENKKNKNKNKNKNENEKENNKSKIEKNLMSFMIKKLSQVKYSIPHMLIYVRKDVCQLILFYLFIY